jgi:hypothetical protein
LELVSGALRRKQELGLVLAGSGTRARINGSGSAQPGSPTVLPNVDGGLAKIVIAKSLSTDHDN